MILIKHEELSRQTIVGTLSVIDSSEHSFACQDEILTISVLDNTENCDATSEILDPINVSNLPSAGGDGLLRRSHTTGM